MKKKIFIIFGVILILISAFQNKIYAYNPVIDGAREHMSDMLEDMQNNGEISQELYEVLQKQANTELTKAEMTDKLKENLFFFAVGQYANISQDLVADAMLSLADIWDYIFWDNDSQSFGFDEVVGDYIKNGLNSVIYETPSQTVGNWVSVPCKTSTISTNGITYYEDFESDGVAYATIVRHDSVYQILLASFINGTVVSRYEVYVGHGRYFQADYTLTSRYQGSESVGFYGGYATGEPFTMVGSSGYYYSQETALADLFGWNGSSDPYLDGAIIVNDNPVFPSLSPLGALSPNYKNIVITNYNNGNPYPPNRGLNVNYYDYDYNYDVPFWAGQELESLEFSQEIDFPSIEFETVEVDSNIDTAIESLSGWIIDFLLIAILLLVLGLII